MKKEDFKELIEKSVSVAVASIGWNIAYLQDITIDPKTYNINLLFDNEHDATGFTLYFDDIEMDAIDIIQKYERRLEDDILESNYKKYIAELIIKDEYSSIESLDNWKKTINK